MCPFSFLNGHHGSNYLSEVDRQGGIHDREQDEDDDDEVESWATSIRSIQLLNEWDIQALQSFQYDVGFVLVGYMMGIGIWGTNSDMQVFVIASAVAGEVFRNNVGILNDKRGFEIFGCVNTYMDKISKSVSPLRTRDTADVGMWKTTITGGLFVMIAGLVALDLISP